MPKKQENKEFLESIENSAVPNAAQDKKSDTVKSQQRILKIYNALAEGRSLKKQDLVAEFGVSVRTIERDINLIRDMVENPSVDELADIIGAQETDEFETHRTVKLSKGEYRLVPPLRNVMKSSQAFTLLKMLLECRGLNEEEMKSFKNLIIDLCIAPHEKNDFKSIINREWLNYIGPQHNKAVVETVWELQQAMLRKKIIKINYKRNDGVEVDRLVIPVGIMFSDYYFYMIAYIKRKEDASKETSESFPTVYRVDRIQSFQETSQVFTDHEVSREKQCTEGEFRNRVQFMFGGYLYRVTFDCKNSALEANLDRFPSHEIVKSGPEFTTLRVMVYGKTGIEMWLRSQGEAVCNIDYKRALGKLS